MALNQFLLTYLFADWLLDGNELSRTGQRDHRRLRPTSPNQCFKKHGGKCIAWPIYRPKCCIDTKHIENITRLHINYLSFAAQSSVCMHSKENNEKSIRYYAIGLRFTKSSMMSA